MLKSILLSCIALGALASGAFASDLPTHKGPPPAPTVVAPVFSWTGFYIGANGGYADPTAKLSVAPGGHWVGDADWGYFGPAPRGVDAQRPKHRTAWVCRRRNRWLQLSDQ